MSLTGGDRRYNEASGDGAGRINTVAVKRQTLRILNRQMSGDGPVLRNIG